MQYLFHLPSYIWHGVCLSVFIFVVIMFGTGFVCLSVVWVTYVWHCVSLLVGWLGELCFALGLSICWLGELCFALGLLVG